MAFAHQILARPEFHLPHLTLPKPRWPRPGPRTRAFLMMGLMISPAFVSDYIGYGVERLFYTAAQIAEMRAPDDPMLKHMTVFQVACADPSAPVAEQRSWSAVAAERGWPVYPEAGNGCFRPDRALLGVVGLKTFNVACPTLLLTVADRQRWMQFAADHGWGPYPQAGTDCVDP
jgi:hypothetical protein